jgi:hypothetical protein
MIKLNQVKGNGRVSLIADFSYFKTIYIKALQMKRSQLQKIIQEEIHEHMIEESITDWLVDKVSSGFKWYTNKKADYQYDALLSDKGFKSLAKKYGMSERDWDKKARQLISKDPKKFANMLAYDYKSQSFNSKGYKI